MRKSLGTLVLMLAIAVAGCAAPTGRAAGGGGDTSPSRSTPKRVVAAIMADPPIVSRTLNPGSHWRGVEHLQALPLEVDVSDARKAAVHTYGEHTYVDRYIVVSE